MQNSEIIKSQIQIAKQCFGNNINELEHNSLIYRRHAQEQVDRHLSFVYPVLKKQLGNEIWLLSIDELISTVLYKGSLEVVFIELVQKNSENYKSYLADLAKYEMGLYRLLLFPSIKTLDYIRVGDVLLDSPVLNPVNELLYLKYPVHTSQNLLGREYEQEVRLLIFRRESDYMIDFIELTPIEYYILSRYTTSTLSFRDLLIDTSQLFQIKNFLSMEILAAKFVFDLLKREAILGFTNKGFIG